VTIKTAYGLAKLHNLQRETDEKRPFKVGFFISPHILTFRERCQIIDGETMKTNYIPKVKVIRHAQTIFKLIEDHCQVIHDAGGDV
jgi:folylpolyglutamate synthase/dihydropteroate synthase